jgi:hypothetical protein
VPAMNPLSLLSADPLPQLHSSSDITYLSWLTPSLGHCHLLLPFSFFFHTPVLKATHACSFYFLNISRIHLVSDNVSAIGNIKKDIASFLIISRELSLGWGITSTTAFCCLKSRNLTEQGGN